MAGRNWLFRTGSSAGNRMLEVECLTMRRGQIGLLMWVRSWNRVLDHAARRFRFCDDPLPIVFFELIGDLHRSSLRGSCFRTERNLCMRLGSLNRYFGDIDVHGAEAQSFKRSKMTRDSGANRICITLLLMTSGNQRKSETHRA